MRLTLLSLLMGMGMSIFAQEAVKVMTLQECVTLAVENNLNVQRARLNLETAEVNKRQADFQRLPNANANSSFGYSWGRSIDPSSNQFITQRIESFNVGAQSGLVLFNGQSINNSIKRSGSDVSAAEFDVEKASNDVQLNVVTFYLNVIFNKELLENARYQLRSSQEQLERTKKLVEAGSLPRTNELELMSQVSTNEVNVITAENNLNLAYLTLKQVMLLPVVENIDVVIPELQIEEVNISMSTEEVYNNAQQNMPEIKSADMRVRSAEYAYMSTRGGYYPTLTLTGGVSTIYSDARVEFVPDGGGSLGSTGLVTSGGEDVLSFSPTGDFETIPFGNQLKDNLSRFISLGLTVPIFNRFNQRSAVQRSKITMQQASINAVEQQNFLRQTIETAFNDVQAASKTYAAATKQVEALEETFRSIENQYNFGAANFTDYQVASNNLFRARSDQSRAKFDFIFKKKLLDFYQGIPIF